MMDNRMTDGQMERWVGKWMGGQEDEFHTRQTRALTQPIAMPEWSAEWEAEALGGAEATTGSQSKASNRERKK